MDATTLEKLKKEAADALSNALGNSTQWVNAPGLVKVLETLDGMKAEAFSPSVPCFASEYQKGACVFPGGHNGRHSYEVGTAEKVGAALGAGVASDSGVAAAQAVRARALEALERTAMGDFAPIGTYAKAKTPDGVGVLTPPLPPKPCPVLGCTYSAGHNAPHNTLSGCACPDTWHGQTWHTMDCPKVAKDMAQGVTVPKTQAKRCPHDNIGCGISRICEVCKGETKRRDPDGGGPVQGLTFDPPVSMKQADAAMDALKANIPSGQAMLLDGPAPTPAQVAHIRAEMLEEAAKDVEALSVCIPNPATVARILRNMKPKVSK